MHCGGVELVAGEGAADVHCAGVLQERADEGEVEVVAGDDDGEGEAEAVADDLEGDVVDVGAVAGEEDEGLVARGGESRDAAEVGDFVGGDVDAVVVGAGEELDDEEVGALGGG